MRLDYPAGLCEQDSSTYTVLSIFVAGGEDRPAAFAVCYYYDSDPANRLLCIRHIGNEGSSVPEFVGPRIPLEESGGFVDFGVEPATVPLIAYGGSGIIALCDDYCRISLYDVDNGSLVMGVTVTTVDGLLVTAPTGFAFQLVMVGGTTAAIFVVTASITPTTTSIFVCVQPFVGRSAANRRESWSASTWVQSDINVTHVQSVVFDSFRPNVAWLSSCAGPISFIVDTTIPIVPIPSTNWIEGVLTAFDGATEELESMCHTMRLCVSSYFAARDALSPAASDLAVKMREACFYNFTEEIIPTRLAVRSGRMVACTPKHLVFSASESVAECDRGLLPLPVSSAIDAAISPSSNMVACVTEQKVLYVTRWPGFSAPADKAVLFLREPDSLNYRKQIGCVPQNMVLFCGNFILCQANGPGVHVFEAMLSESAGVESA